MTNMYSVMHSVFRKQESTQIREEELFSSKRCLEWFYEYAGTAFTSYMSYHSMEVCVLITCGKLNG